ncbi:MAG: hypothetical protein ACI4D8_06745 [Wujia sp.]
MLRENKGSAVIEATLIIPVFLVSMLTLYKVGECVMADNIVYEALVETSEYMAEYAYINNHVEVIPYIKFCSYVDDEELLENYVENGVEGVTFWGTRPVDDDGYITLQARYTLYIDLPFLPRLEKTKDIYIRQMAYTGAEIAEREFDTDEIYVYVTPNREAYHYSRSCSYLEKTFRASGMERAIEEGYEPCEYCGDSVTGICYVTVDGEKYHSTMECVGLKATVYRVRLSEVKGLGGCIRCTME